MSALPPQPPIQDLEPLDQFLVGYGKSGAVGVFMAPDTTPLRRGTVVVIQTVRGFERGTVLGPATIRQARLLGAVSSGTIVRCATPEDERQHADLTRRAHALFDTSRLRARAAGLAIDLLDVDLLLDGRLAVLQFVGTETDLDGFAESLQAEFALDVRLENLAMPVAEEHAGCGKPDCGKEAGGCSTCSTGGGCSSCGSAKVDMRDYFGHLRAQMEQRRTPLL